MRGRTLGVGAMKQLEVRVEIVKAVDTRKGF